MCVAILPALAIAATVASTAVSAYGAAKQQAAQNSADAYNASIQERNAQVAEMQAKDAEARGKVAANQHDLGVKGMIGSQRAAAASSGLLADEGSNLTTTQDTAGFGKLDSLTIQSNAAKEAWGYRVAGANSSASAGLLSSSMGSTALAGASPLLSGISGLGSKIYQFKQDGAFK